MVFKRQELPAALKSRKHEDLRQLHVSYLFITHDLATVKAIADEIVLTLLP